jgi:hypothetical protein
MRHFTIILVVLKFSNCGFLLYYVYPLSFWDKEGEYFFVLDRECISKPVKCFFVLEWPKWEFVSILYWQHSG